MRVDTTVGMVSERRESPRVPVALDVVLKYRAQSIICTIRDLSLRGAFVDAEPEFLPFDGAIELGLTMASQGQPQQYRLPATIRRITDRGAGIAFGDLGQDAYFSLVDLYTSPRPRLA